MEGGKEEAAQTHPFYPALVYGAFRPHGENPKHELLPSLFRTNFYFYFFRLASELQQPAATYAAGGWGREEESQFIKFYFAVENLPVALKHFIKKSFNSKKNIFCYQSLKKFTCQICFLLVFPTGLEGSILLPSFIPSLWHTWSLIPAWCESTGSWVHSSHWANCTAALSSLCLRD